MQTSQTLTWSIFLIVVAGIFFYLLSAAGNVDDGGGDFMVPTGEPEVNYGILSVGSGSGATEENKTGGTGVVHEDVNNNNMHMEYIVTMSTSKGDITLELYPNKAPKTVENFIKLAQAGFYDGTKFHRIIKDFMIQAGDPLSKDDSLQDQWGTGGPGYTFEDEFNDELITKGALAMANSGPNTNGSQFFIVTTEAAPWLDGKHTVFGRVTSGIDVVDAIEAVDTEGADRPVVGVVIESISIK